MSRLIRRIADMKLPFPSCGVTSPPRRQVRRGNGKDPGASANPQAVELRPSSERPCTLSLCVSGCVYLHDTASEGTIGDRGVRDRGRLVRFDLPESKPCPGTAAAFSMAGQGSSRTDPDPVSTSSGGVVVLAVGRVL